MVKMAIPMYKRGEGLISNRVEVPVFLGIPEEVEGYARQDSL